GEGRHIVEWGANMIDGFLDGVESQISNAEDSMNDVISSMYPDYLKAPPVEQGRQPGVETEKLEDLLIELISAVQEKRTFRIGGRDFEEYVGSVADDQGGNRVRMSERGLARG